MKSDISTALRLINHPLLTGITSVDHHFIKNNRFLKKIETDELLDRMGIRVTDYAVIYFLHQFLED